MKNREKWRQIIQEVKAHPELYRRGEGRKDAMFTAERRSLCDVLYT
jgi:hypothetical protein